MRYERQVGKDHSPEISQAQKEAEGWELPPSQGGHDLLKATPETIQEIVNRCVLQRGSSAQVAADFLAATAGPLQENRQPRAIEYAMAYTIEHHAHQPGYLRRLLLLGGNMKKFYEEDVAGFGMFIARYPQAVEAIPAWTAEAGTEVQGFLDRCNKLLTTYPTKDGPRSSHCNGTANCERGLVHG